METPKKPLKNTGSKNSGFDADESAADSRAKKKFDDDDDDDDYDMPLDDMDYEEYDDFDDDDY